MAIDTSRLPCDRYKGPTRQKLFGPILNRLHEECVAEQKAFLDDHTGFGRALTGDGATIQGTKYLNFLLHEYGRGVMLLFITDCSQRQQEVGTIESTFIAHNMIKAIRSASVLIFIITIMNVFIYF